MTETLDPTTPETLEKPRQPVEPLDSQQVPSVELVDQGGEAARGWSSRRSPLRGTRCPHRASAVPPLGR